MDNKIRDSILKTIGKIVQIGMVLIVCSAVAIGQDRMAQVGKNGMVYNSIPITQDAAESTVLNKIISITVQDAPLLEAVEKIAEKAHLEMVYNSKLLETKNRHVSVSLEQVTVEKALWAVLEETGLRFAVSADKQLVLLERREAKNSLQRIPVGTQETISGTVTDAQSGETLPGVNVIVKGTTTGTSTDSEGGFELTVESLQDTLVVTYIGYQRQEVPINGRTEINIQLTVQAISGEEMVVVGYGTVEKSDLTGSLSSVEGEDLNAFPSTNTLQALTGRAAGVQVIQNNGAPGGAISVRIRGTNSIRGSNEPLYVVDGFPMTGSNPTILNNSDIESIEVLKDASATAIYGSRGANGVVLITTKKGKAGTTSVDYESTFSVQQLRKKIDMMNAREYALFHNEAAENDGLAQRFTTDQIEELDEGFDWQDFVFRNAPMQNHNLTVSGGNEKTQVLSSLSMFNQDGIIRNSGYERYSLRSNINHDISSKLNINANVTLTKVKQANQNSSGGGRGISLIAASLNALPTVTPYNDDGSIRNLQTIHPWAIELMNPAYYLDETNSDSRSNKVLGNVAMEYQPLPDLNIRLAGGIDFSDDKNDYYQSTRYLNSNGHATVSSSETTSLLGEATINYTKTFGEHQITALLGGTYQDFRYTSMSATGAGFLSDVFETYDIGAASSPGIPQTGYSLSVLLSGLGRVNYNYQDKILATLSFRSDGSSRYSAGNKWGYFPSGALAWRVSEEEFMRNIKGISNLKLRLGWGISGSQAISAYSTLNRLNPGKTAMGDGLYTTFGPGVTLPSSLRWESTREVNMGVDTGFINNRFRLTVDYYVKTTKDLLNPVPLPSSTGYVNTIRNVGSIQNKGIEFEVGTDILSGDVKWSAAGNISFNRSKVIKLFDGADILGTAYNVTLFDEPINILREGEAFGAFYGYRTDGYTETGMLKYKDLNNDGTLTTDDKVIIGNPNPDFFYGLRTSVTYKNLDLSIFLQGVTGNEIFNLSSVNNTLDVFFGGNMPREVYTDHWTPENTDAKYPLPSTSRNVRVSDRFVENGSYLRLKNIKLSYNLPINTSGSSILKNIQLSVSGQNLLTFTNYSWWDPEVNSQGGSSSVNQGIDYYTYPNYKSITIGIQAQF